MKTHAINATTYQPQYFGNKSKEKANQAKPIVNNKAYNPKVWATALALATLTTACDNTSTEHADNFNSELTSKKELLSQQNTHKIVENNEILTEIKNTGNNNIYHDRMIWELEKENKYHRDFKIEKLEDGSYLTKTVLNNHLITATINFDKKAAAKQEYTGILTIKNKSKEEPADTFEYKLVCDNKTLGSRFNIELKHAKDDEIYESGQLIRNFIDNKLYYINQSGVKELNGLDRKDRPYYSQNEMKEYLDEKRAEFQDIRDNVERTLLITFITGLAVGLLSGGILKIKEKNENTEDNNNQE